MSFMIEAFLQREEYSTIQFLWGYHSTTARLRIHRLRQVRHEPQRDRQFIELEMRTQERNRPIGTRLARNFRNLDGCRAQRELGLLFLRRVVIEQHVLRYPAIQKGLDVLRGRKTTDLVAHHRLEIVGNARDGKDVLELR